MDESQVKSLIVMVSAIATLSAGKESKRNVTVYLRVMV